MRSSNKKILYTAFAVLASIPILGIIGPQLVIHFVCSGAGLCGAFIYWQLLAGFIILPLLASAILITIAVMRRK